MKTYIDNKNKKAIVVDKTFLNDLDFKTCLSNNQGEDVFLISSTLLGDKLTDVVKPWVPKLLDELVCILGIYEIKFCREIDVDEEWEEMNV